MTKLKKTMTTFNVMLAHPVGKKEFDITEKVRSECQ